MKFEYSYITTAGAELEVDDIGNCCLMARDSLQQEYYLIIKTALGWTELIKYGPIVPAFAQLPNYVSYTYTRLEYNEARITKQIELFINPPKAIISSVELCEMNDIKPFIRNFVDVLYEE